MTPTPLIEVSNLVNRFGTQTIHDGLDLQLYEKEILGLVGGSGSGKSVLLRSILGIHRPTSGTITIKGQDNNSDDTIASRGVLFQNGALFSSMSVLDNVALSLREHTNLPDSEIEELAHAKLQIVGLKPDASAKKPSELSGGMVKRAALARALALDPDILFLDEPTAGLDPIAAASFDKLILDLRDLFGLSVFIITHDLDTLTTICDRIAMLVDKKITVGTLDDMLRSDHPWIKEYFTGPRMRAALGKGQ
jgi:phospholipid/cholesterol/gamma-HCH transport system ATP-binding protein